MITIQEAQDRVVRQGWSEEEVLKLLSPEDQKLWPWTIIIA